MHRQLDLNYLPRSPAAHAYFIHWAIHEFGGPDYVPGRYQWEDLKLSSGGQQKLLWLYDLGYDRLRYLNCPYPDFEQAIMFGTRSYRDPRVGFCDPAKYYPGRHGPRFREGGHFRQHGVTAKMPDARRQAQDQWRTHKGFDRDRRRSGRRYHNRGSKQMGKHWSHREHRRWETQLLHLAAWEDFFDNKLYYLYNSWYWD